MNSKRHLVVSRLLVIFVILLGFSVTEGKTDDFDYGRIAGLLPSDGKIFGWIKDLWGFGYQSEIGFRQPGSAGDAQAANYVRDKFQAFGLQDVQLEPVEGWTLWTPTEFDLTVQAGGTEETIPCGYRPYTAFTDPEGVTAELVHVGTGMSDGDFEEAEGKIVLVDLIAPGLPSDLRLMYSPFAYDPGNTLPGTKATQNWPVANIGDSYERAIAHGAVGYVGILNFLTDGMKDYYAPYTGILTELPGLYVPREQGAYLKEMLTGGPVEATLLLEGETSPGVTYNASGVLPGQTDEIILVTSHHDGWAANEASGASEVMALAEYFSELPADSRQRTLMFLAAGGHFLGDIPTKAFIAQHPEIMDRMVISLSLEMVGREYVEIDGEFVPTGLVAPRGLFISGPPFGVNPTLLSFAENSIPDYDLDRTIVLPANGPLGPAPPGVAAWYFLAGKPIMHLIAAPAHQFTPYDTPNKVDVEQLRRVTAAYADLIMQIDAADADDLTD
jgi:hypothetical protein